VHAVDHPVGDVQAVDAVPEPELHEPLRHGLAHAALERCDHAGTGAPRDVEARHRVAVAVRESAAALRPADDGEEPHAHPVQPGALLAIGEVDVGGGPLAAPEVLAARVVDTAVELRAAEPVLHGEVERVADAQTPLLGGVDQEEPAERPEGLTAEVRLGLLVEQQHPPAGVGQLRRRHESRESGPHHDHVRVHVATLLPFGGVVNTACQGVTRPVLIRFRAASIVV